jgi:hypothetical protein
MISSTLRIVPRALTVFRYHRLAAIVDIHVQRRQDESDGGTALPAEPYACGRYRLSAAEDTIVTEPQNDEP